MTIACVPSLKLHYYKNGTWLKMLLHWLYQNLSKCFSMEILSFWWNCHHKLPWNLSTWQLPVQPVTKISLKQYFCFSVTAICYMYITQYSDALIWVYISPVFWPVLNVPLSLSPCGLIPGLMGIRTQGTPQSTNKDTQAFITSDYEVGTRGYTNMASNTISRNTAIENTQKTLWILDCF